MLPPLAQVEVPAVQHRAVPPPRPDPIILVGKTENDIRAYLGEPDLTRREGPGEIWRYGDESCGIHLFFYEDQGMMEVEHVETRVDGKSGLKEADCLDRLRRQNLPSPAN